MITIIHRNGSELEGRLNSIERDRAVIQFGTSGTRELWLTNTKTKPDRRGTFREKYMAMWHVSSDTLTTLLKAWGEKYLPDAVAKVRRIR